MYDLWVQQYYCASAMRDNNYYMNYQPSYQSQLDSKAEQYSLNHPKNRIAIYRNANFCTRKHPRNQTLKHHLDLITADYQNLAKYGTLDYRNTDESIAATKQLQIAPLATLQPVPTMHNLSEQLFNSRQIKSSAEQRKEHTSNRQVLTSRSSRNCNFSPSFCHTIPLSSRSNSRIHQNPECCHVRKKVSIIDLIKKSKQLKPNPHSKLQWKDLEKVENKNRSVRKKLLRFDRKTAKFAKESFGWMEKAAQIDVKPWHVLETQI